jgi:hypothetical protein
MVQARQFGAAFEVITIGIRAGVLRDRIRRMKKVAAILIICGVGLTAYGLLNFHAWGGPVGSPLDRGWELGYSIEARLEAAIGMAVLTAGCLLKAAARIQAE